MRKKISLIILALVMSIAGGLVALGCGGGGGEPSVYTVTFVDASGETITTMTVNDGQTADNTGITVPEKAGFNVIWTVNGEEYDFTTPVKGDITITAEYKERTDTLYTSIYYVETLAGGYEKFDEKSESATTNSAVTIDTSLKITGFTFDQSNSNNVVTSTVNGDGTTVLKAYYKRNVYTVKFMADGEEIDSATVKYGAVVAETEQEVANKNQNQTSYEKFSHWSATEGGSEYNFTTQVIENLTLYAVYTEEYVDYSIDVALGNSFFYLLTEEGEYYEDLDIDMNAFHYGDQFKFKILFTDEAKGTPQVSVKEQVIEPVDGVYTITVDGDVMVEIVVDCKTYAVTGSLLMYENDKLAAWQKTITDFSDVVIKIDDEYVYDAVNQAGTYYVDALVKGSYTLEFMAEDGEDFKPISNEKVEFFVSGAELDDGEAYVVENAVTVGYTAYTVSNENWVMGESGALENSSYSSSYKDNVAVSFDGLELDGKDFVASISFDQSLIAEEKSMEGEPTLGMNFVDKDGNVLLIAFYNSGNMRVKYNNSADMFGENNTETLICGVGGMLGMSGWGDCYRRVTLTYVKHGDWFSVLFTGDANGQNNIAKPFENLLLISVDLSSGTLYTKEKMSGNGTALQGTGTFFVNDFPQAKTVFANLATIEGVFQVSKLCYADIAGWSYTSDKTVVDQFVAMTKSTVTVKCDQGATVTYSNGFTAGEGDSKILNMLAYDKDQAITVQLKEGYVATSIKLNGAEYPFIVDEDNIITIAFTKGTQTAGQFDFEITTVEGTYVTISGTIDGSAIPGFDKMTSNPVVIIYNDENSYEIAAEGNTFSAKIFDGTYTIALKDTNMYTATPLTGVKATDEDIELALSQRVLGGAVTIGDTTFYSGGCVQDLDATPMVVTAYKGHGYEITERDGKEVTTATAATPARQVMLFSDFAAEQFVVRATYTYKQVSDRWNVYGFVVIDEYGQFGHIGAYGKTANDIVRTVATSTRWENMKGNRIAGGSQLGRANCWYDGGYTIEYAMVYDKGDVRMFAYSETVYGPGWECLYTGKIPTYGSTITNGAIAQLGTELSGPVAVGLVDTQNRAGGPASWEWSNYSAVAGQEAVDAFLAQTIKLSAEASAKVSADLGGEAQIDWDTEEYRLVKLTPKNEGDKIVDVKINGVSTEYAIYDTNTGNADVIVKFDVNVSELVIDVTTSTNANAYVRKSNSVELVDNGDGTYKSVTTTSAPQETAMKDASGKEVTFDPKTQKLVFTYSTHREETVGNVDLYDFQAGMFIRSADGGMLRLGFTRNGDVLRMRTAIYRLSGNYLIPGNTDPWTALGAACGYHSSGHTGKLYIRVTVDGYNWKIEAKTGEGCNCKKDWCVLLGGNVNVYDEYNNDYPCTTVNNDGAAAATYDKGIVNNMFVNDLYSTNFPCTFGLSVISEKGLDKTVIFEDISYEITNK